jgi:hypothetical protein
MNPIYIIWTGITESGEKMPQQTTMDADEIERNMIKTSKEENYHINVPSWYRWLNFGMFIDSFMMGRKVDSGQYPYLKDIIVYSVHVDKTEAAQALCKLVEKIQNEKKN